MVDIASELLSKLDRIIELLETKTGKPKPKPSQGGSLVWEEYCSAFHSKYLEKPIRNARANALCVQLVARLGEEAPSVASFFLKHTDQIYIRSKHDLSLLVRDAEKLRLEWKTGKISTSRDARDAEFASDVRSQLRRAEEI
jgi:hypothetical protein